VAAERHPVLRRELSIKVRDKSLSTSRLARAKRFAPILLLLRERCDLEDTDERFEAFPDPLDNWMVWDNYEDDIAEVGTKRLHTLTRVTARAFSSLLNKLFFAEGRLDTIN